MNQIRVLEEESIPCWYELTLRKEGDDPKIVLRLHKELTTHQPTLLSTYGPIVRLKESLGLSSFQGVFGYDLGFKRSLKYLGENQGFLEYLIPLPVCRKILEEPCAYCDGSGYDKERELKCFGCQNGRQTATSYDEAFVILGSLSVLLQWLYYPSLTTSASFPQLLTVQTHVARGLHGSSLMGIYGPELTSYLSLLRNPGVVPEVTEAMQLVWAKMQNGLEEHDKKEFECFTQGKDGWLGIGCPGDRTCLHPTHSFSREKERGYEFSSHNVDTPAQQLTLLTGLAALHDLTRPYFSHF